MKGYSNKTGLPHKPPKGKGRPILPEHEKKQSKTFRLSPDVIEILSNQDKPVEFLEMAIREKHKKAP